MICSDDGLNLLNDISPGCKAILSLNFLNDNDFFGWEEITSSTWSKATRRNEDVEEDNDDDDDEGDTDALDNDEDEIDEEIGLDNNDNEEIWAPSLQ